MTDVPATAPRERWNARYDGDGFEPFPALAAEWLLEHDDLLGDGAGRTALDVACGDGRNARHLAELGFAVDAIDVSDVAVARLGAAAAERGLRVVAHAVDLERDGLPAKTYDVVLCMNYLQRDLFAGLLKALAPGGLLLYETFSRAHVDELGRSFNPAFVLEPNELLRAFGDLHVLRYREGVVDLREGPRGVASIVARRLVASG